MSSQITIWSERWQLARLRRPEIIRFALLGAIVGLAVVLFHCQGNTTDIRQFGRSALLWMIGYWNDAAAFGGSDYSHGWLIPIASLVLIWRQREELAAAPKRVSLAGLGVVVLALLLHWVGTKAQQTRLSLAGLILLTWGLPFYFCGWRVARMILFPCAFLIYCIPLNFVEDSTQGLRTIATVASEVILNGLGIPVEREGSMIRSIGSQGSIAFDVAGPCSGIHSLLAATSIAAVYAYLTQRTLARQWALWLMTIPLAIIGNIARIVSVGLVSQAYGHQVAHGAWHDFSGWIFYVVVILLMIGLGNLLHKDFGQIWRNWKQRLSARTSLRSA